MRFGDWFLFSVGVGLVMGAAYSVLGLLLLPYGGETALSSHGMDVKELLLAYLAGGVMGGVTVGLLHPLLARSGLFAAVVGYVAIFPFMLAVGILSGQTGPDSGLFEDSAMASVIGAVVGFALWKDKSFRRLLSELGRQGRGRRGAKN